MPLEIKWLSLFSSFFTKNLFFKIKPVLKKKLERNSHRSEKKMSARTWKRGSIVMRYLQICCVREYCYDICKCINTTYCSKTANVPHDSILIYLEDNS